MAMKRDVKQIVKEVNGSMAIENMPLTRSDKKMLMDCGQKKISCQETVSKLVQQYTQR
jgi:hypothetical protein